MSATWNDLLHPGEARDFFSRRPFPVFHPTDSRYNPDNARWLAEFSRLAYRDPPLPLPLGNHFPANAQVRHTLFVSTATNTQAMLVEFDGETPFAVLAFRGTAYGVKNILTDLNVGKITLGNQKVHVHEGFLSALESVWCQIEPALALLTCPLFFTGHSLGAALATLAAARHVPTALYTFGSPRVGDAAFVDALDGIANRIHRLVVDDDVVASLPPLVLGFEHVGVLKILHAAPRHGWGISGLIHFLTHPAKPLADHAPISYVDRT